MSRDYKKIPSEKQFNQDKIIDIMCSIYDWQFKRFKNRAEREHYRNEYDAIKAKLENFVTVIKAQKEMPTMKEDEIKRLDYDKAILERDLDIYKTKMEQYDNEFTGVQEHYEKNDKGELVRGSDGLPVSIPAQPGIETMIEALRELKQLYVGYIKIL